MKVAFLSALVLLNCLYFVTAAPIFDDDDFDFSIPDISVDCTNLGCPSEATSCSKRTSTTQDKQHITEELKCYNAQGVATKDEITSKRNPYPNSIQNGYVFYGSYSGGTQISNGGDGHTTNNHEVETFTK